MDTFKSYEIVYISAQSVLSMSGAFLNGLSLIAMVKKSSLHTPSNAVLGGLCCNDFLLGLLTLPWLLLSILKKFGINFETAYNVLFYISLLCIANSCLFVVLANIDRYVAICHPFAYVHYATVKLSAAISCFASFLCTLVVMAAKLLDWMYSSYSANVIFTIAVCAIAFILIYCNWKIIRVVLKHRRQIASTRLNSDGHLSGFQRETKSYRITVLLVMLFVVCKLPPALFYMAINISKVKNTLFIIILPMLAEVLLVLNSLLNPIVYCFSGRVFRNAIKELLCCK